MTYRISFAISFSLLVSVFLSGCERFSEERLSEKDKMDMIVTCDTEARKKSDDHKDQVPTASFKDQDRLITTETHYSLSDKKCYGLRKESVFKYQENTFDLLSSYEVEILYDGLTSETLLYTNCARDVSFNKNDACIMGGGVIGPLVMNRVSNFEEAQSLIKERMNSP
ncbi:MAG: hypothetical protein FJY62_00515 [Betaproteobacteria bacterium]|nr:hypothetical protein [Betaproteobacteria bacterium]